MNTSVFELVKNFSTQNNVIQQANLHYFTVSKRRVSISINTNKVLNLFLKTTFDYAIDRADNRATIIVNSKVNKNDLVLSVKDYGDIPCEEVLSFFNIDYNIIKNYNRFGAHDSIFINGVKELFNKSITVTLDKNQYSEIEFHGYFPLQS